mmetsp:Transcript_12001/g.32526  ORF Transcript_12001/g.32526 Transcript_12001/m.32526 type:complete len:89 (+) Transcript_12001:197-463(+)
MGSSQCWITIFNQIIRNHVRGKYIRRLDRCEQNKRKKEKKERREEERKRLTQTSRYRQPPPIFSKDTSPSRLHSNSHQPTPPHSCHSA